MRISDWSSDVCSSDLAVDVDPAAFEYPVLIVDRQARPGGERRADFPVARHDEFLAPPVEQEIACPPRRPRSRDDRPGIAQPDIAERPDEYLHTRIDEPGGDVRRQRILYHTPPPLPAAPGGAGVVQRRQTAPPITHLSRRY